LVPFFSSVVRAKRRVPKPIRLLVLLPGSHRDNSREDGINKVIWLLLPPIMPGDSSKREVGEDQQQDNNRKREVGEDQQQDNNRKREAGVVLTQVH